MVFCLYSVRYRSVGWVVSSGMRTRHLPLTSMETKYLLDACHHGDTLGLIHHLEHTVQSDHRVHYMRMGIKAGFDQCAMIVSTGSIDHSYDNALAQSVNGAYKTELIRERTLMSIKDLEQATICVAGHDGIPIAFTHLLGYKTPHNRTRTLHTTQNKE